VHATG